MATKTINTELAAFKKRNPGFDLMEIDFFNLKSISKLKKLMPSAEITDKQQLIEKLMLMQRLQRVAGDEKTAEKLISLGLHSAHHISNIPEKKFTRLYGSKLNTKKQPDKTKQVHENALAVTAKIRHAFANVHSMVASPHFSNATFNHVSGELADYIQGIPNYRDLFGSMDYCKCDQCKSIFSPAAYFLDIMRITDDYITDPNKNKPSGVIQPGMSLADRRPDLFDLPLTCDNTNTAIPFLQIVNRIIESKLQNDFRVSDGVAKEGTSSTITLNSAASPDLNAYAGMEIEINAGTGKGQKRMIQSYNGSNKEATLSDKWEIIPDSTSGYSIYQNVNAVLASAVYPFNLPYHPALEQIRLYLGQVNTSLKNIYGDFLKPVNFGTVASAANNTITLSSAASDKNNAYTSMVIEIAGGKGIGQKRDITDYAGEKKQATVAKDWEIIPDNTSKYYIYDLLPEARESLGLSIEEYELLLCPAIIDGKSISPRYGYEDFDINKLVSVLTPLDDFLYRTKLERAQFISLIVQDLDTEELQAGLALKFFINNTGDPDYLQVITDDKDPDNPYEKIINLSIKRLDRLCRFIRLQSALKWSFADLDWIMKITGNDEITPQLIITLSEIKRLQAATGLLPLEIGSFITDMKTSGRVHAAAPQDFFDLVFNNPQVLRNQRPYSSTAYVPFNPALSFPWTIKGSTATDEAIRSRLKSALCLNDNDLSLLATFVCWLVNPSSLNKDTLLLSISNLSWMYRLSKLSSILKLNVNDCLLLLSLVYFPDEPNYIYPKAGAIKPGLDILVKLSAVADWLKLSRFTLPQLQYIITGSIQHKFYRGYDPLQLPAFIQKLEVLAENSRLKKESFVFEDIDASTSAFVHSEMIQKKMIDSNGIVLLNNINFADSSSLFPIGQDVFETNEVSKNESVGVFNTLSSAAHQIIILLPGNKPTGNLSEVFTQYSSLQFLFLEEDDPVSSYDGVSRTATVANKWVTIPDTNSWYEVINTVNSGKAQQGTDSTIVLDNNASGKDGDYKGMIVSITGGKGIGQQRIITGYTGIDKTATVDKDWKEIPDSTSMYSVIEIVNEGYAQNATETTIVLDKEASAVNNAYDGMTIRITEDPDAALKRSQVREVLLTYKKGIEHTSQVYHTFFELQNKNALEELSAYLGTSSQILSLLLPFTASVSDLKDYLQTLLSPVPANLQDVFKAFLYKDAFVTDGLIDSAASGTAYDLLCSNTNHFLINEDVLPGEQPRAYVNITFTETSLLDFLFDNEPQAAIKRAQVRKILLLSKRAALIEKLTDNTARGMMLVNTIGLSADETDAVFNQPSCFNILNLSALTIENTVTISEFKNLITSFNDTGNRLIEYFKLPMDGGSDGQKINVLSKLTGWDSKQLFTLIGKFWPADGIPEENAGYDSVSGIYRLKQCFDLGKKTGIDVIRLLSLYELNSKSICTKDGVIDIENWRYYEDAARALLSDVSAQAGVEAFTTLTVALNKILDTKKRDALVGFCIWHLSGEPFFIKKPSDLYQYFLIDVEMSACDSVSLIAQGISSVQLYMQRCRLMQEEGVTDLSGIKDTWWEWMMKYRVWEANRKIFLYPENYIDPALRRDKTSLFKKFAESMLQTNIDKTTVSEAMLSYFDEFYTLGGLEYCDAYNCSKKIPGSEATESQLFLFARTNTQPHKYYYRIHYPEAGKWEEWKPIDLTINSRYISPVYAYDKLFIFWTEKSQSETQEINGGTVDNKHKITQAEVKYAFYDQAGKWREPQTTVKPIIEDYYPSSYGDHLYIDPNLFNVEDLYWNKVYALKIPSKIIDTNPEKVEPERILVSLGALYNLPAYVYTLPVPPGDNLKKDNPDLYDFEMTIYKTIERVNAMVNNHNTRTGKIFLNQATLVSPNLQELNPHVVLIDYSELSLDPPPYRPELLLENQQVNVILSNNILYDNYFGDYISRDTSGRVNASPTLHKKNKNKKQDAFVPIEILYNVSPVKGNIITVKNQMGWFMFNNGDVQFLFTANDKGLKTISEILVEQNESISGLPNEIDLRCGLYSSSQPDFANLKFEVYRLSTITVLKFSERLFLGGIDSLFTLEAQRIAEIPLTQFYKTGNSNPPQGIIIPDPNTINVLDFKGAYGLYFWEIFFHVPFLIADTLKADQRFEDAMNWYQYIFNPTQQPDGTESNPNERFWRFLPFRSLSIESLIETLSDPAQIRAYNDDPFDPDAIARLRPVAYAKAVVMKYIDNLLKWGDFLFAQGTRESITQASNLYIMASDLLGPRPKIFEGLATPKPQSFNDIRKSYDNQTVREGTTILATKNTVTLDSGSSPEKDAYTGMYIEIQSPLAAAEVQYIVAYDGKNHVAKINGKWSTEPAAGSKFRIYKQGIPQFFIRLENSAVVKNSSNKQQVYSSLAFNDIPSYFCVPENPEFIAYWDYVEDRLFKIRHCQNIAGVERSLELFSPPIDPNMLIRAASSGNGLMVSQQLEPQVPYYRFTYMIEKTMALTNMLTQFGSSLLSALEKKDADALSMLQVTQEGKLQALTSSIKLQQIDELIMTKASLRESLLSAQERFNFYSDLIDKDLSPAEIINIAAMTAAMICNTSAAISGAAASIAYAIPNIGSPFAMTYGGQQIGAVISSVSSVFEAAGTVSNFIAQLSLTIAGYQRRAEDWGLQKKIAEFDGNQINYQIEANKIQIAIAEQEYKIQEETIRQNAKMESFLLDKFTNQELYQWMVNRLSTVYFQAYSLCFELATVTQRAYQFELNNTQTFVNFGYWDSLKKGLLSGEGLMLALGQMQKSYIDKNVRLFEIQKNISLASLNPFALLDLISKGSCIFELNEKLFDDDFPGHYARKIKSISISIPAVLGPYQNINAILTQLSNQVVLTPDLNAVNFLLGENDATMPEAKTMRSNWWINQQVALSRGVDDSGLFELNFSDERYLPFEGTGAVSSWRLSMSKASNHFDFNAISDVIMQLKYTALNGGTTFRDQVLDLDTMKSYSGNRMLNLAENYSSQWYSFLNIHSDNLTQQLLFDVKDFVPRHIENAVLTGFYFLLNVTAGIDTKGTGNYIRFNIADNTSVDFNLEKDNMFFSSFGQKIKVSEMKKDLSLVFTLATAPPDLKVQGTPGYLNPDVIKGAVLVLFYEGEIKWK
ncbi:MAG TPA: neuraminidase-like domain-containing protein [Chitinophagaceae bacterium]